MSTLEAFILGLIQGATEFLPVSSSGHLVIAETLFGITDHNLAIAIILHLGTFFAIVAAYWKSVWNLIREFFLMLFDLIRFKGLNLKKSKYRYYLIYIIIGTIPAGIVGYLFDDIIEGLFSEIYVVAITLFITGFILLYGEKIGSKNTQPLEELGPGKAFVVGLFQMVAIVPGISRSGTTMVGGLTCGLKKEDALEFSFLLALPAILGSVVLNLSDLTGTIQSISITPILVGFLTALVVGYLSILLFKLVVKKGSLLVFSVYCWIVSLLLIVNLSSFM
jgi:undecaprenyl-diphosphatase